MLPLIAAHKPVTATINLLVLIREADTCWDHIADQSTSAAAQWITDTILRSVSSCIPLTALRSRTSSNPWLNDRSTVLVDAKRAAEGTLPEKETTLACSAGLAAACHGHTARTVQKMRCRGQAVVEEGKASYETRSPGDQAPAWASLVMDAHGKANLCVGTFPGNCKLLCLRRNS